MTRVGFIGLGSQGRPMARRVVESGFPLTLWARRPESLESFANTDTSVVASPAQLGAASDVVGLCVVADADVEDVLVRDDGVLSGMSPGGVVVIHSTIHPETCRRLADQAANFQIALVDAPVSGGGGAAAEGSLLVMVGGNDADVARCRPVLETFGNPIVHLGPLGSGQMVKLLNNLVFTAQVHSPSRPSRSSMLSAWTAVRWLRFWPTAAEEVGPQAFSRRRVSTWRDSEAQRPFCKKTSESPWTLPTAAGHRSRPTSLPWHVSLSLR